MTGRMCGAVSVAAAMLALGACWNGRADLVAQQPGTRDISARLDSAVRAGVPRGFSGSVLFARGDTILLDRGYGDDGARRIAPETRFWIASVAKQFASAALLRCGELGRLGLDDPITRFLPAVPPEKRSITTRQLLLHTSGLPQSYVGEEAPTREEAVRRMLGEALVDTPGKAFHYANSNYLLATAVVEIACREPYRDFVRRELWTPAGMESTGFADEPAAGEVALAVSETPPRLRRFGWGNKSVFATTGDLFRWYGALRAGRVLTPASVDQLFRPGTTIQEGAAALGWFVGRTERDRVRIFTRGNDAFGPNALLYAYPESGTVLVVLTHAGNAPDGTSWSRHVLAQLELLSGL